MKGPIVECWWALAFILVGAAGFRLVEQPPALEPGSWADWAGAFATTAAVVVALFAPAWQLRKASHQRLSAALGLVEMSGFAMAWCVRNVDKTVADGKAIHWMPVARPLQQLAAKVASFPMHELADANFQVALDLTLTGLNTTVEVLINSTRENWPQRRQDILPLIEGLKVVERSTRERLR